MAEGIAAQVSSLRTELKDWERKFAETHDNRRAGRDDIKADPIISSKYKEYSRLHGILKGKPADDKPAPKSTRAIEGKQSSNSRQKRKADDDVFKTPSKRRHSQAITTPSRNRTSSKATTYESPSAIRELSTPTPRKTMIGPTPQKDGVMLGLFDCLSDGTPTNHARVALGALEPNVLKTPTKGPAGNDGSSGTGLRRKFERTPMSEGKRFLLDSIVTPIKRKRGQENTPVSPAKNDITPPFLRRDHFALKAVPEEEEDDVMTQIARPWKRRTFGRSLSSFFKDAEVRERKEADDELARRKREEERLDEELDLLRELEQEEAESKATSALQVPVTQVEDSQADVALGPDGGFGSDVDEGYQNEQDPGEASVGRTWKKKGAKRQTRRAVLRPTRHRPQPPPEPQNAPDSKDEGVAETQVQDVQLQESDDAEESAFNERKPKPTTKENAQAIAEDGPMKKRLRKVNELAHANFVKLKIKNKNSKAQGRGRFGRGRR